jgi:uncharacterized membrane protein YqjE
LATEPTPSELGQAIQDVTERASTLVREEIELAKAEMTEKISKLVKGAAVGAVAGVFVLAGLIYFLHALSWLIWQLIGGETNYWLGFIIVAVVLFLLAAVAGLVARRAIQSGTPPKPELAIEEAQLIKATLTSPPPPRPTVGEAASTPARQGTVTPARPGSGTGR